MVVVRYTTMNSDPSNEIPKGLPPQHPLPCVSCCTPGASTSPDGVTRAQKSSQLTSSWVPSHTTM